MIKLKEALKNRNNHMYLLLLIISALLLIISTLFLISRKDNVPLNMVNMYFKDMGNNYGVESLSIKTIEKVKDSQHIQNILNDEDAKAMDLTKENIILVDAHFSITYDNTKVPASSNDNEYLQFVLIRLNKDSSWIIAEKGQGLGGIPYIDFNNPYPNKNLELYVWKNNELTGNNDTYYTLLDGTDRKKEKNEIYDLLISTNHIDTINRELSGYLDFVNLSIYHMNTTDFTKNDMTNIADQIIISSDNNSKSIGLYSN